VTDSKVRRRAALIVLALLAFVLFHTISRDLPREQQLVFRFPLGERPPAEELTASFTRVGEREARAGISLSLRELKGHDIRCSVHLPNGDYIVTVELTEGAANSGSKETPASNKKTSDPTLTPTTPNAANSAGNASDSRGTSAGTASASSTRNSAGTASASRPGERNRVETLVVRRVTLEGAESIVPLGARTSE
jgi:hypothetical protein